MRISTRSCWLQGALWAGLVCQIWAVPEKNAVAEEEGSGQWKLEEVPASWKRLTSGRYVSKGGFSWFRCLVEVPADWEGTPAELFVEAVDDAREIYFNGQRVGSLGTFPPEYRSGLGRSERLALKAGLVLYGQANLVAVRIHQNQSRSNFNVAAPVLFAGKKAIRLQGKWEATPGDDLAWARLSERSRVAAVTRFRRIEDAQVVLDSLKRLNPDDRPRSPAESLGRMDIPDDLTLELAVGEPAVRQPLSMKWDALGRLWVLQYLQYPDPAGLKMVSRDKYLRAVYDKVPPPPPHHFPGRDKVTIHEDTNGDGRYDQHKTFVEGLSLATSFAIGRGGVFVLNPPYLLFYPDRDRDDVPDSDPQVLLEGFGLEDSHSIANSLQWGPDGWLYGCQGSTVSAAIRKYGSQDPPVRSLGQLIWRYHPESQRYEIFAEGGGNSFGLEIDSKGRVYSGHNGGNTRGFHYVQGGYFQKGFGKHGQLSNPYAFGYFPWMTHHAVQRFTHVFVIYEGGALPANYHGKLFGVGPLQGHVVYSQVEPQGSSFQTRDLGHPLKSRDPWCRPVDIKVGPDGALYVADLYEQRIDHASHYQGRIHRETGRIYRLRGKTAGRPTIPGIALLDSQALVGLLADAHPNKWVRQTILRVLADRRDRSIVPQLMEILAERTGQASLDALWALHLSGGLNSPTALALLEHQDPYVRLWTVRLLADDGRVTAEEAEQLQKRAAAEVHVEVRSQLACSARRLPASQALPIVAQLAARSADVGDIHVPLLLWWAIETHAESSRDQVLQLFQNATFWKQPLVEKHLLERVMRRYARAGKRADLLACAQLLGFAPDQESAKQLLAALETAFQGRSLGAWPAELVDAVIKSGGGSLGLRVRQGNPAALQDALRRVASSQSPLEERRELVTILGEIRQPQAEALLLQLVGGNHDPSLTITALTALQAFQAPQIGARVISLYPDLKPEVQPAAQSLLSSRRDWALQLLHAVESQRIKAAAIPGAMVRKMMLHEDAQLRALVVKHFGKVQGATTSQMLAEIKRLTEVIGTGSGVPHNGKQLYMQSCGKCHKLFTAGGEIGPNLTSFQRQDLQRVLVNVVNPSLEIREGYENYRVITEDGRVLTGFVVDQDDQLVVLRGADGQTTILQRDAIEEIAATPQSLMPEELLKRLNDQQVRDLFAFLRSSQPVP